MFERGWGVDRDPEEAKKWNNRASRAENTPAEQREPAGKGLLSKPAEGSPA
jgi:TPR repeat protein